METLARGQRLRIFMFKCLFVYLFTRNVDGVMFSRYEELRVEEKSNPVPSIARDLQLSNDYIENPCELLQYAELSPLLEIDELQRQKEVHLFIINST